VPLRGGVTTRGGGIYPYWGAENHPQDLRLLHPPGRDQLLQKEKVYLREGGVHRGGKYWSCRGKEAERREKQKLPGGGIGRRGRVQPSKKKVVRDICRGSASRWDRRPQGGRPSALRAQQEKKEHAVTIQRKGEGKVTSRKRNHQGGGRIDHHTIRKRGRGWSPIMEELLIERR